jgi:uncharacterized SAM-binding protein YcdF (DUF218 family)
MKKLLLTAFVTAAAVLVAAGLVYLTISSGNTQRSRFDVIIVLGYPANPDGTPSAIERARVMEGVREYRRGVAPALLMTGGAAHNQRIEADVMADFAVTQGIPASAVLREEQAHNTIENAYYSVRLMQARGWRTAEVVSSPSHIRRASLTFAHFPIEYRVHGAANPTETGWLYGAAAYIYEAWHTDRIRLLGFGPSRYLP